MLVIANQPTSDDFTAALTLESKLAIRAVYVVANASALVQFKTPDSFAWAPPDPGMLVSPQSGSVERCTGIRFRSAVAGTPARIVAQLLEPADPQPVSGVPFTQTLTAAGGVGPVAGAVLSELTIAATVTISGGTEAAPTAIFAGASVTFDGTTAVYLEACSPLFVGLAWDTRFDIWDDAVPAEAAVGHLGRQNGSASDYRAPLYLRSAKFTPAAGAHAYGLRAWRAGGAGGNPTWGAGPGGASADALEPSTLRIVVA